MQVKSTHNSKRRIPIALSNWQRAIEDPLPWFYLVLRYARDDGRILEVAAVHLDKGLIERVMQHIHSVDASKLRQLHRMKYPLTWSDSDVLSELPSTSAALRSRVESAVPKNLLHYAETKRGWSANAGWAPTKQLQFAIAAPTEDELYQRLARVALGFEESVAVSGVRVTRERFGRTTDDPEFPRESVAHIHIGESDEDKNWLLGVSDAAGSDELTLPVMARLAAAIIPGLPKKYWLARIRTPFLDVTVDWATGKMTMSVRLPQPATPVKLMDLTRSLQLVTRLMQSQGRKNRLSLTKEPHRIVFNCIIPML